MQGWWDLRGPHYLECSLLGENRPFSELLQEMVNRMFKGEMEVFMLEHRTDGKVHKRNGKISKEVLFQSGLLCEETSRDHNGDISPELTGKREQGFLS